MFSRGHFTAIKFLHAQNFFEKLLAPARGIAYINNPQADMAQLVEHNLAKVGVAGSSPVVRSIAFPDRLGGPFSAKWPSGKAEACKAFTPGSNPGFASRSPKGPSEKRAPFRSRAPDGGDSAGVPLRPLRLRNPPAPAAGAPLQLPDPGAFPNEAINPIWHGPKTVQMGFLAPFGIRTFAEGRHVLGRFLDTLLSIKHYLSIMHQLYVYLHIRSAYPLLKKSLRGILSL